MIIPRKEDAQDTRVVRGGVQIIRLTQPLLIFQLEIQHPRSINISLPPSEKCLDEVWFEDVSYGVSWEEKLGEKSVSNWTVITVYVSPGLPIGVSVQCYHALWDAKQVAHLAELFQQRTKSSAGAVC